MKRLLPILLLISSFYAFAQTGEVTGVILDKEYNNQPLPFADVYIKGTTKGASTDFDGKFTISNIDAGTQTLIITFVGYETKQVTINIEAGKTTTINESLSAGQTLESVVVQGTSAVKESEAALLQEQKKAVTIVEAIGSEELSRKAVSDASGAVAKISGISKQGSGGNNVYVRGLGDRYLNTTFNGLPLPSNDVEKKNIDLNLFASSIIQNVAVSKTFASEFYGDFGAGNVNIASKEHSGKSFIALEIGSTANTEGLSEQAFRTEATGFSGFFRRHSINPFNVSATENVDPIKAESNVGVSGSLAAGKKWSFDNNSSLSLFGSASFDTYAEFREGSAVDFSTVERQAFSNINEHEFGRTTTLLGTAVYKINPKNKIKFTSLYVNDATDEVGFYGLDGQGRNREGRISTDEGFFISNTQFDQNTIIVNQLTGNNKISDKLKLNWGAGYNKVLARQPDRRRFVFEQFNLALDDDPTTNATFFNNVDFDNQRYFQDIVDDEFNFRANANYELNEAVKLNVGYNFRNKERDFQNIRYGFSFDGDRVEAPSVFNLNSVINQDNLGELYDLVVFRPIDNLNPNPNQPGLAENTYNGKLLVHAGFLGSSIQFGEKLNVSPGLRIEKFNQEITYDAINISPVDPRFREADELFFLPSLNAKYELKDNINLRLSASRTVSTPEFKEVSPHVYEGVNSRIGGNPDLLGSTPFSNIYNVDTKFEYYLERGEIISFTLFGKQINDPVNRVITSDATGVQRFFRTGDKAEVWGFEIEARKKLILNADDDPILSGGFNFAYTNTRQDLKTVNSEVPGGFNTAFNRTSDQLQGASPIIVNADLTYNLPFEKFKPQATIVYSQFSDRINALGAGNLGNIIEKSIPTLDFVWKNKFNENVDLSFIAKNILNPNIDFIREDSSGDILISRYKRGLDIGIKIKYNFK